MPFPQKDAEQLLVATGRECSICQLPHQVSLHHIVPPDQGGTDEIDNAIPLCPNCHDAVHGSHAAGRTTRAYTSEELRWHRQTQIERVSKRGGWAPGTDAWEADRQLILKYAQCLDRPAFRTHFHSELSFADFDRAMEDTLLALNTGYWRTRDGMIIERGRGKVHLINPPWRATIDEITEIIESIRTRFREALGLEHMLLDFERFDPRMDMRLRADRELGQWMDQQRQRAINLINPVLIEVGNQPLKSLHQIDER